MRKAALAVPAVLALAGGSGAATPQALVTEVTIPAPSSQPGVTLLADDTGTVSDAIKSAGGGDADADAVPGGTAAA